MRIADRHIGMVMLNKFISLEKLGLNSEFLSDWLLHTLGLVPHITNG